MQAPILDWDALLPTRMIGALDGTCPVVEKEPFGMVWGVDFGAEFATECMDWIERVVPVTGSSEEAIK
jgi:hypothetical protein